jgi:hypothetical protein
LTHHAILRNTALAVGSPLLNLRFPESRPTNHVKTPIIHPLSS